MPQTLLKAAKCDSFECIACCTVITFTLAGMKKSGKIPQTGC